jgi:hypothetical protein
MYGWDGTIQFSATLVNLSLDASLVGRRAAWQKAKAHPGRRTDDVTVAQNGDKVYVEL